MMINQPGFTGDNATRLPASSGISARHSDRPTLRTPRPIRDNPSNDVLFRVELALSRLDNGDYGYCVRCDNPIPIPELEHDPSAVVCKACRKPDA